MNKVPCPLHGHPGNIRPGLRVWIDFWNVIAPYCENSALDHILISKICDEYGLNFIESFERLTWILKALNGSENHRDEESDPEYEETL